MSRKLTNEQIEFIVESATEQVETILENVSKLIKDFGGNNEDAKVIDSLLKSRGILYSCIANPQERK